MVNKKDNFVEDRTHAWQYFTTHAEQRLKTFHFFLIIMTLLVGTIFTLVKLNHTFFIIIISFLMSFFSFIFWKLDQRNRELIDHAQNILKKLEKKSMVQLFTEEAKNTNKKRDENDHLVWFKQHFTYSDSFRWVFRLFGIGGVLIAVLTLIYETIIFLNSQVLIEYLKNSNFFEVYLISNFVIFCVTFGILFFLFNFLSYKRLYSVCIALLLSIFFVLSINVVNFDKLFVLELDKINISFNNNDKKDVASLRKISTVNLFFNKGSILLNENLLSKRLLKKHINNKNILDSVIQSMNNKHKYYIKLQGFSSLEKVIEFNKIIDNYQISLARANNTKKYILEQLVQKEFPLNKILFDVFGVSNEMTKNTNHAINRRVEIEIYQMK
jgi:flagellar motor protein MotB